MSTDFSSLPIVDLAALRNSASREEVASIGDALHRVFSTTGFAYLVNSPLTLSQEEIFGLARKLFGISQEEKMRIAKKTFRPENPNTYRGYFPLQPGRQDNLKEGFEVGPASRSEQVAHPAPKDPKGRFDLSEPNVWPSAAEFPADLRTKIEGLHSELQDLSMRLLGLLALALGDEDFVTGWLDDSVSTLRFLHYPPQPVSHDDADGQEEDVELCCTPHTDSGILTLLHQDPTGGLEVRNASGAWIPAPHVPGSIVVNIGDLMARVSGGRYVATLHRVRACAGSGAAGGGDAMGRLSVPFFFEPGERCLVRSVDGGDGGVLYGDHVRAKMSTWVEFQDVEGGADTTR